MRGWVEGESYVILTFFLSIFQFADKFLSKVRIFYQPSPSILPSLFRHQVVQSSRNSNQPQKRSTKALLWTMSTNYTNSIDHLFYIFSGYKKLFERYEDTVQVLLTVSFFSHRSLKFNIMFCGASSSTELIRQLLL